jgi:hypothetical protein
MGVGLKTQITLSCPKGAASSSPRLRLGATLGGRGMNHQPQRGCAIETHPGRNPFRVDPRCRLVPKVAPEAQPWAEGRRHVG